MKITIVVYIQYILYIWSIIAWLDLNWITIMEPWTQKWGLRPHVQQCAKKGGRHTEVGSQGAEVTEVVKEPIGRRAPAEIRSIWSSSRRYIRESSNGSSQGRLAPRCPHGRTDILGGLRPWRARFGHPSIGCRVSWLTHLCRVVRSSGSVSLCWQARIVFELQGVTIQ